MEKFRAQLKEEMKKYMLARIDKMWDSSPDETVQNCYSLFRENRLQFDLSLFVGEKGTPTRFLEKVTPKHKSSEPQ